MRPLRALAIYFAVVFIGGALLAPWLYWLAHNGAQALPGLAAHPFYQKILRSPFHRFVDRALLGLALIGLWPLLRALGMKSWGDVGVVSLAGQGKRLGGGFLLGFLSLAFVAGVALAAGARQVNGTLPAARLIESLSGVTLTAAVVAVLEEILFRGALFGSLRKMFDWVFALVLSSLVYATVHFLSSSDAIRTVTWLSGLELLPHMLFGAGHWAQMIPKFCNLTFAGLLLGLAYQRTGNLYFSMGLHAGWIFWLKSYGILTVATPASRGGLWWWGGGGLIDGWFALPVLAGALWIFQKLPFERRTAPAHEHLF